MFIPSNLGFKAYFSKNKITAAAAAVAGAGAAFSL